MEEGNLYEGTEEELKSAVLAFIVDGHKGRTLEEICKVITLKEEEAKDILRKLESSGLTHSSVINGEEKWFSLAEVA